MQKQRKEILQLYTSGPRAVIINEKGEILVSRRQDTGISELPGGGQEIDEEIDIALAREIKEETGLCVKAKRLIAGYEEFSKYAEHNGYPVYTKATFWLCDILCGEIKNNAPHENKSVKWISQKQIKEYADKGLFIKRQFLILEEFFKGHIGIYITRGNRIIY